MDNSHCPKADDAFFRVVDSAGSEIFFMDQDTIMCAFVIPRSCFYEVLHDVDYLEIFKLLALGTP